MVWRSKVGIEDFLLVPTLYSDSLTWDGSTVETPEFVDDGGVCMSTSTWMHAHVHVDGGLTQCGCPLVHVRAS